MRARRRHERAHLRQRGDQRVLAQEGRFTRHVRAGDDGDGAGAVARQVAIIGCERLAARAQRRLDDGMASARNIEGERLVDDRPRPALRIGDLGERC